MQDPDCNGGKYPVWFSLYTTAANKLKTKNGLSATVTRAVQTLHWHTGASDTGH